MRAAPFDTRLRAKGLRAGFSDATRGIEVNLELLAGARLAVTGPSGSGKTTLLMTLAGLLPSIAKDASSDASISSTR